MPNPIDPSRTFEDLASVHCPGDRCTRFRRVPLSAVRDAAAYFKGCSEAQLCCDPDHERYIECAQLHDPTTGERLPECRTTMCEGAFETDAVPGAPLRSGPTLVVPGWTCVTVCTLALCAMVGAYAYKRRRRRTAQPPVSEGAPAAAPEDPPPTATPTQILVRDPGNAFHFIQRPQGSAKEEDGVPDVR